MNQDLLNIVLQQKELFVPLIFTEKQFLVLQKQSSKLPLSGAEKKSLYTSVKKKMDSLGAIARGQRNREYWINGSREIIPGRLEQAKKLIDAYAKKYDRVFISGSFLFSKKFNDIDIFVVRERGYREVWEKGGHLIFLAAKRLSRPVFQSAAQISVSNFIIPGKIIKAKPSLPELMATYHEAVIECMKKEKKPESIRRLVFDFNLFCRDILLNGKELNLASNSSKPGDLGKFMQELCKTFFSMKYLYVELHNYIKTLNESIRKITPNAHLMRFRDTYEEIIYGRQRSKAEAA